MALIEVNPYTESAHPESEGYHFRVSDPFYHENEIVTYDLQATVTLELLDGTMLGKYHHFPIGETEVIVTGYTRHGVLVDRKTVSFIVRDQREAENGPVGLTIDKIYSNRITLVAEFPTSLLEYNLKDAVLTNAEYIGSSGYIDDDGQRHYGIEIRPIGPGHITVQLPKGWGVNRENNLTDASNVLLIPSQIGEDTTIEDTQNIIASFQQSRANQLLSNQTGLMSLLTGASETGSAKLSFTEGNGGFDVQTAMDGRVWARLVGSYNNGGTNDQSYVLGTVGSHKKLSDNLLIGGMLQFDQFEQSDDTSAIKGTGWLIGPYIVAKHATQPLYFEGRFMYGASSNDVSPYNTYTDTFKTKRTLAHAKLTGEIDMGEFIILPNASLAYTKDRSVEYIDTLSNMIPSQSVALTQTTAGLTLQKTVNTTGGALTMSAGFSGIYSDVSTTGGASSIADYDGGRGKVDVGMTFKGDKGLNYTFGAYFDGIGADGYNVTGASAGIQLNF